MTNRVVDIDKGWNRIMRKLYRIAAKGHRVEVGWWEEDDPAAAEKALYNEVAGETGGAGRIPPRPVLAPLIDERGKEFADQAASWLADQHLLGSKSVGYVLGRTGRLVVREARKIITNYRTRGTINKDNAPSTIKRKGRNSPLMETGDMRKALTYKVKK